MQAEVLEWILLALSPFLAFGAAFMVFNAFCASRRDVSRSVSDHRLNLAYKTWREWVMARGGLQPAFCPQTFGRNETCFAFEREARTYTPLMPHLSSMPDIPVFDTERGVPVGEGWSILDGFEGVRFIGKGALFVTNMSIYLRGAGCEIRIPLRDVRIVATACSSFLIEANTMDRPLIFTGVNGQMLRDTIHMLLEAA